MGCYLRKTPFAGILNSTMRNNSGPMGAEPGKVINYEFFVNLLSPSSFLEYNSRVQKIHKGFINRGYVYI